VYACNIALQQQLDDFNSKLLAQDSEILNLQDQLKKCQVAQEFNCQPDLKADMIPPRHHCPPDADIALSPAQLSQPLLLPRDDVQVRENHLRRLHNKYDQLQHSFDQVITSSSELLALHVTLIEQHLDLHARQQSCASALSSCQAKLLAADTQVQKTTTQLLETRSKYDTLTAQVTQEDPIARSIVAHGYRVFGSRTENEYIDHHLHALSDQLLVFRPHLRPSPRCWPPHLKPPTTRSGLGGGYYVKIQDPLQSPVG
jgi:hypothetical protein